MIWQYRLNTFILVVMSFFQISTGQLNALQNDSVSLGVGFLDTNRTGGILQVEYKWEKRFWRQLKPQLTVALPEFRSFFIGGGIGWEWEITNCLSLTPSFEVGLYYRGHSKKLGFPVEFRSSIDLSYQLTEKIEAGIQAFHISNAHLCHRNPGLNAYLFYIAFEIK